MRKGEGGMKSLAIKEEEKRLRRYFSNNVEFFNRDGEGYIQCIMPRSFLTDRQVQQVFDLHLLKHYRRKFKWKEYYK